MTTAIQQRSDAAIQKLDTLGPEKLDLLKRTLCPDLTDAQLELFGYQCARTKLDPFAKQIYATVRKDKKTGEKVLTIQTGIDGFRTIAGRTGELDGQDGPYWCGPDGKWVDVWLKSEPPAAAKVIVFRKGCSRGFVGIARFNEYAQRWPSGDLQNLWAKMPANQIAKCAEALGLRKGFPQDLSGLYITEEMQQADNPEPEPKPAPKGKPIQATVVENPAPELPAKPVEAIVEGDPLTDTKAVTLLAHAKGWAWPGIIHSINTKFDANHGVTRTVWIEIPREQREAVVEVLRKLPDKPKEPEKPKEPAPTAADVESLVGKVAELMRLTPLEVFQKLCGKAGWVEVVEYHHLNASQLKVAVGSLRSKLAELQPKTESK